MKEADQLIAGALRDIAAEAGLPGPVADAAWRAGPVRAWDDSKCRNKGGYGRSHGAEIRRRLVWPLDRQHTVD